MINSTENTDKMKRLVRDSGLAEFKKKNLYHNGRVIMSNILKIKVQKSKHGI